MRPALLVAPLLLLACPLANPGPYGPGGGNGGGGGGNGSSDGGLQDGGLDSGTGVLQRPASSSQAHLVQFLQTGAFHAWRSEPAIHWSSSQPHARIRIYVNDSLAGSIDAASLTHPVGSVAVAEDFGTSGTAVVGHSLMLKQAHGTTNDWVWFDGKVPGYSGATYASDQANTCFGCHQGGRDQVWTSAADLP